MIRSPASNFSTTASIEPGKESSMSTLTQTRRPSAAGEATTYRAWVARSAKEPMVLEEVNPAACSGFCSQSAQEPAERFSLLGIGQGEPHNTGDGSGKPHIAAKCAGFCAAGPVGGLFLSRLGNMFLSCRCYFPLRGAVGTDRDGEQVEALEPWFQLSFPLSPLPSVPYHHPHEHRLPCPRFGT
jgi:hypothetical protein